MIAEHTVALPAALAATGVAPAGVWPAIAWPEASLHFELTAIVIESTGWQSAEVQETIMRALPILAQCGVAPRRLRLVQAAAPAAYRDLSPQTSRQLAARLDSLLAATAAPYQAPPEVLPQAPPEAPPQASLPSSIQESPQRSAPASPRPALFFVRNTRMRPAFEAEAFGLGNTRTRPELANTVWVTRHAPDLPETVAHELFHVIANSGEHSGDETNLMHDQTAPGRWQLTPAQCAALREAGLKNRLLRN